MTSFPLPLSPIRQTRTSLSATSRRTRASARIGRATMIGSRSTSTRRFLRIDRGERYVKMAQTQGSGAYLTATCNGSRETATQSAWHVCCSWAPPAGTAMLDVTLIVVGNDLGTLDEVQAYLVRAG